MDLRADQRTVADYDALWSAASAEKLGEEAAAAGLPELAAQYFEDSARFLARCRDASDGGATEHVSMAQAAFPVLPNRQRSQAPLVPSW
jgi:hypothetical protein